MSRLLALQSSKDLHATWSSSWGGDNTRSSYYLEDGATEFQVQGMDWACVSWDGDLRAADSGWHYHSFRGNRWCRIGKAEGQRYLLNAYGVLLTRARQGMVIHVPQGDRVDPTRESRIYDATCRYLADLGTPQLDRGCLAR